MNNQYTEKQLKKFDTITKFTKVLYFILGIMFLLLTLVYPIFLFLAIGSFIISFKYNYKGKPIKPITDDKINNAPVYEPIKASFDYDSLIYSKGIRTYSQTYNCTEIPSTFVMLDLETTGLNNETDRIVEISIIKYQNGEVVDVYNQLINPEIQIPSKASEINGITNEMVKNSPKINEIIEDVYNRVVGNIVAGYNVKFDIGFLSNAFARCSKEIDKLVLIDVLQVVKETIPSKETPNRKLETMKNYFDIENISHRAVADCEVTFEVFKKCIDIKKANILKSEREQQERLEKLNDNEKLFISKLQEELKNINAIDKLNYYIMSDKVINFQLDRSQIGRVKLNGRKYKMQILDKNNVLWLDIETVDEAITNIKHWIKYCKYLSK